MDYREVKTYSEAYQLQKRFEDVQSAAFEATGAAVSTVAEIHLGLEKWPNQDLQNAKQQLERCATAYRFYDQFAKELSDEYAEILSKHLPK